MKNGLNTQETFGFADKGGSGGMESVQTGPEVFHRCLDVACHAGAEDAMTKPEPTAPGGPRSAV